VNTLDANLQQQLCANVRAALAEDIGTGDLTAALVPAGQQARAQVLVRHAAVICGIPWFDEVFAQLSPDIQVTWFVAEGAHVTADTVICKLSGPARAMLTGERTALNFLQTLSATASAANAYMQAVAGTHTTILDTRKTIPGLRLAQKYAVRIGGGSNHRIGLYDGILIKENHIAASGSIANAVAAALRQGNDILIEVEVETLEQVREAIAAGAHRLLLDNFTLPQMQAAVALRDSLKQQVTLEASGGVNLASVKEIAATGVDFISVGSITKDVKAVDLSMRFEML
jgi:nicotinate-nucleotide pyrophosphorylase (carboxylating)